MCYLFSRAIPGTTSAIEEIGAILSVERGIIPVVSVPYAAPRRIDFLAPWNGISLIYQWIRQELQVCNALLVVVLKSARASG
jgi:hypothetical protein